MYVSSASSVLRCTGVAAQRAIVKRGGTRAPSRSARIAHRSIQRGRTSASLPAMRYGFGDATTNLVSTALGTAASVPSPATPFLAAAAGLVALFGNIFKGCGNTCIEATQYANQAGSQLDTLKAQYFALPTPRPYAAQQAFLSACQQIFGWLQQMCGNPALGSAGQNCISQRLTQRACPSTLPNIDWCDYWSFYYNPVLNDPDVAPATSSASSAVSSATSGVTSALASILPASVSGFLTDTIFGLPVWLVGGGALVAVWLISEEL